MENVLKKFYQFGLNSEHNFGVFMEPNNKYSNFGNKISHVETIKPDNFSSLKREPNNRKDISHMKSQMVNLSTDNFMNKLNQTQNGQGQPIPKHFNFSEYDNKSHLPFSSNTNGKSTPNNNQFKSSPEVDMKIQQLQLKIDNMEKQNKEEKQILLDIINHNILGIKPYENPNIMNNLKSNTRLDSANNKNGNPLNRELSSIEKDIYYNVDGIPEDKRTIKGLTIDETKVALKRLKALKDGLNKQMEDEELRGHNERTELEADMKIMHSEVMSKLQRLENTRRMQMERVAFILEHSGSSRVKGMTNRLFGGCKFILNLNIICYLFS